MSFIRHDIVEAYQIPVSPNDQLALLADDKTRMASLGEIDIHLTRGDIKVRLRALVMKQLQAPCFGGTTFHFDNNVQPMIRTRQIKINKHVLFQSDEKLPIPLPSGISTESQDATLKPTKPSICTLQLTKTTTVPPSSSLMIPIGNNPRPDTALVAIQPLFGNADWSPQICNITAHGIPYTNNSDKLLLANKKSKFLCMPASDTKPLPHVSAPPPQTRLTNNLTEDPLSIILSNTRVSILSPHQKDTLTALHKDNIKAFDNDLSSGYNALSGNFFMNLNFKKDVLPESKICPIPLYNRKCASLQQALLDKLEEQNVIVDPHKHNIQVKKLSPSFILQKGRAKHKKLDDCSTDELRWVVGFNGLNDYLLPKPSKPTSARNILTFLARHKFHIFADLHNSYFQIPVAKRDWQWLGIRTPFRGIRVLTRAGQGLLNSETELDELVSRILGDELLEGICYIERDDIVIGGDSIDTAISNWKKVLSKLNLNNMKLSPRKVKIFPQDMEVFGWRIKDGQAMPSDHIVTSLGKSSIDQLSTVKQVNSWKGLYKTLLSSLPHLASVMDPFDKVTSKLESKQKFPWSPDLIAAFNNAQSHLKEVNSLTLPNPEEQLILMPDGARVPGGLGWALFVQRTVQSQSKLFPVQFFSAKLKPYMQKWLPCEIEGVASAMAIDACAHWILASAKPTIVTPDCKAVVEAVERMRQGKLSRNPRLQAILICINRRPVTFIHSSAKTGQHNIPDAASRLDITCHSKDCVVERFLSDIPDNTSCMSLTTCLSDLFTKDTNPCIIAATSEQVMNSLTGCVSLPIGDRNLWKSIQKQDPELTKVMDMINTGDSPRKSSSRSINAIFKHATMIEGLLMVSQTDQNSFEDLSKIVIPRSFIPSVLAMIHLKGNHPSKYQSAKVFNRYFFSPGFNDQLDTFYKQCYLCTAVKKIPEQDSVPHASQSPTQPGTHMNLDVIRRAKQFILINVDVFSKFITTTLIKSESRQHLLQGIIQVVTPLRRSSITTVKTDSAPALHSLAKNPCPELKSLGISIVLGDVFNKNSNCHVDQIIQELENEIRKLETNHLEQLTPATLAKATMLVNSKIRHHGLSANDITFRREIATNKPVTVTDEKIAQLHNQHRQGSCNADQPSTLQKPTPGDIVLLKKNPSKHEIRQPFLVTSKKGDFVNVKKILPSDRSRSMRMSSRSQTTHQSFLFPFKGTLNTTNPPPRSPNQPKEYNPHAKETSDSEISSDDDSSPSNGSDMHNRVRQPLNMPAQEISRPPPDPPDNAYQLQEEIQARHQQIALSPNNPFRLLIQLEKDARHAAQQRLHHLPSQPTGNESPPSPTMSPNPPNNRPRRHQAIAARRRIDEYYNIPQNDGAASLDVSLSSAGASLPNSRPVSSLWYHEDHIYGLEEDLTFYNKLLVESTPNIPMLQDKEEIDNTWTHFNSCWSWTPRLRSVSESDAVDRKPLILSPSLSLN